MVLDLYPVKRRPVVLWFSPTFIRLLFLLIILKYCLCTYEILNNFRKYPICHLLAYFHLVDRRSVHFPQKIMCKPDGPTLKGQGEAATEAVVKLAPKLSDILCKLRNGCPCTEMRTETHVELDKQPDIQNVNLNQSLWMGI